MAQVRMPAVDLAFVLNFPVGHWEQAHLATLRYWPAGHDRMQSIVVVGEVDEATVFHLPVASRCMPDGQLVHAEVVYAHTQGSPLFPPYPRLRRRSLAWHPLYFPAGQGVHEGRAAEPVYLPAGHVLHGMVPALLLVVNVACRPASMYLLGAQLAQGALPYLHTKGSPLLPPYPRLRRRSSPLQGVYLPAGQVVHCHFPVSRYWPAGHPPLHGMVVLPLLLSSAPHFPAPT
jgi:hypothetical protein